MKVLNYASAELLDALETLPHHNPTCLEYKQTLPNLIQLLKHPFEKGVHAEIIAMLSECTVQLFGKALSAVGLMERQQLRPDLLAPQWQIGLNHLYQLLGFNMHLPIYGNHRHMPTSAVLAPTAPPALVVHSEVSLPEKTFSHQDAFWVARALYWALPQNQPISIMNPEELRGVFTALQGSPFAASPPQNSTICDSIRSRHLWCLYQIPTQQQ